MIPVRQIIAHWLDLAHGPWCKSSRVTAVIFGYCDGSGTHKGSKVLCVAGFIGDKDAWIDFDERWNRVLDKLEWPSRIRAFGSFDCPHHAEEFRDWPFAERLALFGDLVNVILDSPKLYAVASSNIVDHFSELPPADFDLLKSESLGTALEIVCQHLFQRIISRTRERYSESESCALTFDIEPNPAAEKYFAIYNEHTNRYLHKDDLATSKLLFMSRHDFPPLQAADLLAYTTYQWEMETYYPKNAEPCFPIIPAFLRMVRGIEPDGGRYNLEGLQGLVGLIKQKKYMQLG
jgi:hypothetical protein